MIRILLLGRYGQLGWELERTLAPLGDVVAVDYPEVDLNKAESVKDFIRQARPDVIINATAYTAVDRAESEPDIAMAVNGHAPGIISAEAQNLGAIFLHYSTDYVFDGMKGEPYVETDKPKPINVYGRSKLAGEKAIEEVGGTYLILRTSWVYSLRRDSFVTKVLRWSRERQTLRIVSDQVGNPTWCRMLAEVTAQLLVTGGKDIFTWFHERRGIYHLAGSGFANRLEWAHAILKYDPNPSEQIAREVHSALTSEFPTPSKRPPFSALVCDRFVEVFGLRLPEWEDALRMAMGAD